MQIPLQISFENTRTVRAVRAAIGHHVERLEKYRHHIGDATGAFGTNSPFSRSSSGGRNRHIFPTVHLDWPSASIPAAFRILARFQDTPTAKRQESRFAEREYAELRERMRYVPAGRPAAKLPAQTNFDATPKDCRPQAERSLNPLDKEHWLKIAEEWLKLAQDSGTASRQD
jgi:hypothetical protein